MLSDLQLVYMVPRNSTQLLKINTTKFQVEREPVYNHGGLFMYVHERFDVEPLDLAFLCTKRAGHCVKISQTEPYIKQHVIGNIYKPPYEGLEDFNLFLTEFHDFVNMLSGYGHSSYICGDFNINLLKISTKSHYNTFFENMLSSGFYPKITLPTRICNTSSTIIDNIFSNEMCSNDASGIFVNHISDHQAIFTITSTKLNNRMEQQYVSIETRMMFH